MSRAASLDDFIAKEYQPFSEVQSGTQGWRQHNMCHISSVFGSLAIKRIRPEDIERWLTRFRAWG